MEIEMKIKGLVVDPLSKMPIVVLEDLQSKCILPIWIGVFEANAIALKIENISTPRPMTHDLLKEFLCKFDVSIEKIVINDVRDNTFYAVIYLNQQKKIITVDSRPSDAIALALRLNAHIFVEEHVVGKAQNLKYNRSLEDSENLKTWLDELKPEDFGKYRM